MFCIDNCGILKVLQSYLSIQTDSLATPIYYPGSARLTTLCEVILVPASPKLEPSKTARNNRPAYTRAMSLFLPERKAVYYYFRWRAGMGQT